MEIKDFKKYTNNLSAFTADDVEGFELMSDRELQEYQIVLEDDPDELSQWDHIRAFYTMKDKLL